MAKVYYFERAESCDGASYVVETTCPESYCVRDGYTKLTNKVGQAKYAEQQKAVLVSDIMTACTVDPSSDDGKKRVKVYYVLRSCSASGMKRVFDFYLINHGDIQCITYNLSVCVPVFKLNKNRGVVVDGCGMDMAYHAVDCLWQVLGLQGKVSFNVQSL